MDREQLLSQWREEAARGMSGWDFSHIQGRCTGEPNLALCQKKLAPLGITV